MRGINNKTWNKIPRINAGYILLIVVVVFLFARVMTVLGSTKERGSLAYVQLLNFSMPVVEETTYNEEAYEDNQLSFKRVMTMALGLDKITPFSIVGNEISFLKDKDVISNSYTASLMGINPFLLSEDSIAKVTDEEKAELAQVSKAYNPALKKTLNQAKPEILIYHTHESEGFIEGSSDPNNPDFNVVGVGDVLKKELEENYGISVIHDKTAHSAGDYNNCYNRSKETVKSYLNKYGEFKLIIDLHTDAGPKKESVTANINGEDIAKLMFVNSGNSPRYTANKKYATDLYNIANELFPGMTRSMYEWPRGKGYFNQELADNMVLMEFGAHINKAQEPKRTAKYVARIIAEYLNKQQ